MARYQNAIPTSQGPAELASSIEAFLIKNGFQRIDQDQNVWRKGQGWFLCPQFIRFDIQPGELWLEAWIKMSLLPGVFVGEFGIDGMFLFVPKSMLKSCVKLVERLAEE